MHCERAERWKMLKKSQETWDIIPPKNCFQNKSQENGQESILKIIIEENYSKLNKTEVLQMKSLIRSNRFIQKSVRNANSCAPSQTCCLVNSGLRPNCLYFNKPCRGFRDPQQVFKKLLE